MRLPHSQWSDHHWEKDAACATADPDLFTTVSASQGVRAAENTPQVRAALSYCAACPVWKQCLVSRANLLTEPPLAGTYGRQYVDTDTARARKKRAVARFGKLRQQRVRVIPRCSRNQGKTV